MQYTVKKPINNNILRVVDSTGCELIVTGRGLGFGVKPGYKIEAETVECSYRMTSPAVQQKLVELLERIPYEHLLLTDVLVETIRQRLKYPLNESLLITLADHISFAIQRSEQGIRFSNPLMTSIREFYPEEYHLGMECLATIRQRCHADLSDDNCSEHYKCACCIAEYVRNTWHKELSDEELVFLTIHLKRIWMGK